MVVLERSVIDYLDSLIFELFEEEYFGFVESSEDYVNRIIDFIYKNIKSFPARSTPKQLSGYGKHFIFYKINPRTTWFVFFETDNINFIVTHVINNHCEEAKFL